VPQHSHSPNNSLAAHRLDHGAPIKDLAVICGGILGELNWSSQHLEAGGCDGQSKTAFGTIWAAAIVVTRSTAPWQDAMSGGRFWAAIAAGMASETLRLRPVLPQAIGQDGSGRQAACHQRC